MLMKKLNFIVCLQVFSLGARWDPDPGEQNLETDPDRISITDAVDVVSKQVNNF